MHAVMPAEERRSIGRRPSRSAPQVTAATLRGYTRARCYSSLQFRVGIGILHVKEIAEGELQKALV
jgi:hypothetical protein